MFIFIYIWYLGFPCGSTSKESTCNVGDLGSIPGLGRSPGEGKGYPLQYSGLENSMDSIVHGVAKSWTRLSDIRFHFWYLFFKGRLRHHETKGKWPLTSNQRTPYKGAEVLGFSKGSSIKHNVNSFLFCSTTQHVNSYFLNQAWSPHLLHWKHGVLTSGPPKKSQRCGSFSDVWKKFKKIILGNLQEKTSYVQEENGCQHRN